MAIREITALRKAGQLQEALAAAEQEFAQNINVYTVGALFWCLNDLYKQQKSEEMVVTIERMKTLYHDYCKGNEYMKNSLASAERKLMPHFAMVEDALSEAKNGGNAIVIHQRIFALHSRGEIDKQLYPHLGWLTYYAIKATPHKEVYRRKVLLNQYLQLDLEKPSILHSLILAEAVKIEENNPLHFRIRDFIRLWGLENLREDDWVQHKIDNGNVSSSLVEKLIKIYSKELITDAIASSDDFAEIVDKALAKYPNSQNMPLFKARILISQGRKDEALKHYRNLILRSPSKFYLWSQVSDLVEDIDLKIGLLSKALNCGDDDGFLGTVRIKMATTLRNKGLLPNARYELDQYRNAYQTRGWNPKAESINLYNQLSSVQPTDSNQQIYADYSTIAEQFIYSELPEQITIKVSDKQVEDRNHPGRRYILWTLRTESSVVRLKKPAKFGLSQHVPNGASFVIKVLNDKIVWIKPTQTIPNQNWVKEVAGTVQLRDDKNGNSYTIIEGVYIGTRLLRHISDGQQIKVLAIKQDDGRWSALSIIR